MKHRKQPTLYRSDLDSAQSDTATTTTIIITWLRIRNTLTRFSFHCNPLDALILFYPSGDDSTLVMVWFRYNHVFHQSTAIPSVRDWFDGFVWRRNNINMIHAPIRLRLAINENANHTEGAHHVKRWDATGSLFY